MPTPVLALGASRELRPGCHVWTRNMLEARGQRSCYVGEGGEEEDTHSDSRVSESSQEERGRTLTTGSGPKQPQLSRTQGASDTFTHPLLLPGPVDPGIHAHKWFSLDQPRLNFSTRLAGWRLQQKLKCVCKTQIPPHRRLELCLTHPL